ncbi:16S rRNA (uracil(1498)-N(3))-methyltransferase [Puniceicoccaceae bacterium K14]|nr:16S rRNA (uracil(1498)-N(3))-methyltransferase [Puniceicoccaceae bacterium K14]
MPDFRSYYGDVAGNDIAEIALSPEESAHLVASNRARVGHPVVAFNGKGQEWNCTLSKADKKRAILKVDTSISKQFAGAKISVAQCLPKGKIFENIIRKSTELGAHSIYPLSSDNSEFRLKKERADTKDAKWTQATIEGCKQSGNPFLPIIQSVSTASNLIASDLSAFDIKLVACLRENSISLKKVLKNNLAPNRSALVLIGPEGDLSNRETDAAIEAGFLPFTLGPYVLRCETAALTCLSILRHELA